MIEESLLVPYAPTPCEGVGRALVLAPHPDDETIGCGGAIARHLAAGDAVTVVVLTDGAAGGDPATRAAELAAAAEALGGPTVERWGYPDRRLHEHADAAAARLRALLERRWGRVYCTSPMEVAPDHVAAWRVLARALDGLPAPPEVWAYEIWIPLFPERLVDVSAVWPAKQAALACYASQRAPVDVVRYAELLGELRAFVCGPSVARAEAFALLDPATTAAPLDRRAAAEDRGLRAQLAEVRSRLEGDAGKLAGVLERMAELDRQLGEREAALQAYEASLPGRLTAALRRWWRDGRARIT